MGLFDGGLLGGGGVAGVAQELGKPQDSAQADSYRKPMGVEDFDTFGTSLTEGKAVELAYWEAPAGIARRWGYGTAMAEANQGYAYGVFQNANGEQIDGEVILKWENSTGRGEQVVDEVDSKDIDTTDRYNRDEQVPIPEDTSKKRAEQDERLVGALPFEIPRPGRVGRDVHRELGGTASYHGVRPFDADPVRRANTLTPQFIGGKHDERQPKQIARSGRSLPASQRPQYRPRRRVPVAD
mgnify:CR=1 FL=1